jgi:DNA-binding transcriptional ArsR family regulator
MRPSQHHHPVDAERVRRARAETLPEETAAELVELLGLLRDPVRIRVLFALSTVGELCVGDLAMALDVTADQSSYALKQLRAAGLVVARRDGRIIHHRLADGFPHQLLKHCLHELLAIATKEKSS